MKPFLYRILICVTPVLLSGVIVGWALDRYAHGQGGFKFGVDLVGGTILVYEIDMEKFEGGKLPPDYSAEKLVQALKKRIDPNDLYNVTIRPLGTNRVEVILPTGGAHQAAIEEGHWQAFLAKVREKWPPPEGQDWDITRGQVQDLVSLIKAQHPDANPDEVQKFIDSNYNPDRRRKDVTGEEVQRIKDLIAQVGKLEFRILANDRDEPDVIRKTQEYINSAAKDPKLAEELVRYAEQGKPPPLPKGDNEDGTWGDKRRRYSWVELGRKERRDLHLDNAAAKDTEFIPDTRMRRYTFWHLVAEQRTGQEYARDKDGSFLRDANGLPKLVEGVKRDPAPAIFDRNWGNRLLYSRESKNLRLPDAQRKEKAYDYFMLVRDPEPGKEITGDYLTNVRADFDSTKNSHFVGFTFKGKGDQLFSEITYENKPDQDKFQRQLSIMLDGYIVSAPVIQQQITGSGQISGRFTKTEAEELVRILRSGALPATLKPRPVSENTIGATLGNDTIRSGLIAVVCAFIVVMLFMSAYYRFAGLVASVALMANLIITIAFMIVVSATFTLPGLAGLVLMLGMAVDANVLIYERVREERDRGASLALAIRNGYDRAFPTIIDTHLSSIFTSIVLYVVGNDQLKGFGVSLTAGLIISLFTSLYMTRLIFDIWLARGWLHKLGMFRLLTKTSIDFMRIRYQWFTATIVLTIVGVSVFLLRGEDGLNIDFLKGTAYTGQFAQKPKEEDPHQGARTIADLRVMLSDAKQRERLAVADVKPNDKGNVFDITYKDGTQLTVNFATPIKHLPNEGEEDFKARAKKEVTQRAEHLPKWSVVQIFPSTGTHEGGRSRFFTIRTAETEPDLVQVSIYRLLGENKEGRWTSLMKNIKLVGEPQVEDKLVTLTFSEHASPSYVQDLLRRQFAAKGIANPELMDLRGKGKGKDSRYEVLEIDLNAFYTASQPVPRETLDEILKDFKEEFEARPPTDRLENFDSQMARDTQLRALYAILASWLAVLLYLWFRFGNWTFGLAAVLCLIHDLLFTLGIIAFCHYIATWVPFLATILLIDDFKIDLATIAALLTLVGYSVNDTIVVFDRIREVRGKNPELTPQMINDSVNQTLSRTLLTSFATWLVVIVLYIFGGEGVHLFSFVMVVGIVIGTYSSIYIASPLLLMFGEGTRKRAQPQTEKQ